MIRPQKKITRRQTLGLLLATALAGTGCTQRRAKPTGMALNTEEPGFVLAVVIDLSGSFERFWFADDGRAFRFFERLVDRYFRDRMGNDDRLMIAQISGEKLPLLWEGHPRNFRKQFKTPTAFREYLRQRSNSGGSRVHDSIADTLDYVMLSRPQLGGKTATACVVLSDMEENFPDPERSEQRLVRSLTEFAKKGGWIGFYWVRQDLLTKWLGHLKDAGYKKPWVRIGIEQDPPMPSFDD